MSQTPSAVAPREALQRLQAGNERFLAGTPRHGQVSRAFLTQLSGGQNPHTIILGCSDSRVPPELVFDQGFGDLFVIRLAGNIIAPGVFGSIQYAHQHLGSKLLVVLGHEGCGAIQATLATKFSRAGHPTRVQQLVDLILPGLAEVDPDGPLDVQLQQAVEANVRWSIRQVLTTPEARRAFQAQQEIIIVGAVYELTTGRVRWLDS